MVTVALFVRLKAKAGKEEAVEGFLRGGLPLAQAEPATTAWFALRMGPSTFGVRCLDATLSLHHARHHAAPALERLERIDQVPPHGGAVCVLLWHAAFADLRHRGSLRRT